MVPTEYFVTSMRTHWTTTLANQTSPNLETVWSKMADTFNAVLSGKTDGRWQLLNPETGTGKTEGSCLYLGKLGAHAMTLSSHGRPAAGAIFVARTIDQCEEAVAKINAHAGQEVAVTRHSKNNVKLFDTGLKPILVITHEAFVRSVDKVGDKFVGVWETISNWAAGPRKLTIVDESLTNVVEHHIVTGTALHQLMGDTPHYVVSNFQKESDILWDIASTIRESKRSRLEGREVYLRWRAKEFNLPDCLDWDGYREVLTKAMKSRKTAAEVIKAKLNAHLETIRSIEGITHSWCYVASKGGDQVLTSSRFKVPDDVPGPVILDATASQDVVSYLLGEDRVNLVSMPRSRSYKNVTLHVARAGGVGIGKHEMRNDRTNRSEALMRTISNIDKPGNKWLVVCHKDVEPIAIKVRPQGIHLSLATWGAVDGKNNWNDHDNAVIFGLMYRDEVWSDNSILSLKDSVDEATITDVRKSDMRKMLHNRVLAADIIQAVNRIRCRKVIDVKGNCPSADIWLILPSNKLGDYILEALEAEMPEIRVVDWDYDVLKGEVSTKTITVSPDNFQDAVISYLRNNGAGEYDVNTLAKRLNFDDTTVDKLRKQIKNPQSALRIRLHALGITPIVKGRGRGAKTYLFRPFDLKTAA